MLTQQVPASHVPSIISPFMPPNTNQNTYYYMEQIERSAQWDCFDSFRRVRKSIPLRDLFRALLGAILHHFANIQSSNSTIRHCCPANVSLSSQCWLLSRCWGICVTFALRTRASPHAHTSFPFFTGAARFHKDSRCTDDALDHLKSRCAQRELRVAPVRGKC